MIQLSHRSHFGEVLLRLVLLSWFSSVMTIPKDCALFNESRRILITPKSDISIGVLLPLSSRGPDGACGPQNGYGTLEYEALRWGLQRINMNLGQIGKRIVHDSFIPGVNIGLQIYDTCGTSSNSLTALETLFPDLKDDPGSCSAGENVPLPAPVPMMVLDLTGDLDRVDELKSLVETTGVPVTISDFQQFDNVDDRAKAVLSAASRMGWRRVSLISDDNEFSLVLGQSMVRQAESPKICIIQTKKLREISSQFNDVTKHPQYEEMKEIFLDSDVIAVISSQATAITMMLRFYEFITARSSVVPPLVFVRSFSEEGGNAFHKTVSEVSQNLEDQSKDFNIFQLSFYPPSIPEFQARWQAYQNDNFYESSETKIVTSYLEQLKKCTRIQSPGKRTCDSLKLRKDQELMSTTSSGPILAALHGLFTTVNAIKDAWRNTCGNRKGVCPELKQLSRDRFRSSFLDPLQLSHSKPGSRSPKELSGLKRSTDPPGTMRNISYGLFKVEVNRKKGVLATTVLEIMGNKTTVISQETFIQLTSSRTGNNFTEESCSSGISSRSLFQASVSALEGNEEDGALKDYIFIPSSSGIYVGALFPVHFPSEDGTDCGTLVDPEALQEVEAFLWAIDQINLHQKLLPRTDVGVVVLDTCGSKIRVTNQVTDLMKNSLAKVNVTISQILIFVTSLDADTAGVVGSILETMNITSINLGPSGTHSPFALQMKPPINEQAEAIVQVLGFLGWSFTSLIVSHDDYESRLGANAFKTLAKATGICIAQEMKFPSPNTDYKMVQTLVDRLVKMTDDGARSVVTFLKEGDLKVFLELLKQSVDHGIYSPGMLSFIAGTSWGDNEKKLGEFNEISKGVLLLRDGQKDVEGFTLTYRLLTPANATRNPWFREYWEQHFGCEDGVCTTTTTSEGQIHPVVPYFSTPSTPRVIQAVFSFGAALTQFLDHLCPHAKGKMCPRLPRWRQRIALNEFLRNTEVSRVDDPLEYFQFSENFHGNAPLNIFNLQEAKTGEVGLVKVGRYVDSSLMMFQQPLQTFSNGSSVPYRVLHSSCISNCHFCKAREHEYIFVESPQKVYIMGIFDVHEEGSNPLECGQLRSDQGIQNIESLMWSLKKRNENATVKFGVIIIDTCHSKERLVGEVTNFLRGRIPDALKDKIPSQKHIIAVISGSKGEVIKQLLDVTQPYHLTTIATQARQTFLKDAENYSYLLTLSPLNSDMAGALMSLSEYWGWELVSLVYSDFGDSRDIANRFLEKSSVANLELGTVQSIPLNVTNIDFMFDVWARLAKAGQEGSRVVILLLESPHELFFLQTASKLHEEGLIQPGDFVYVMTKSPRPFLNKEIEALGSLVLQPLNGFVKEFAEYFQSLSIANHVKPYRWFREFWSKLHNCKGAACSKMRAEPIGNHYNYRQSKGVIEASNAVNMVQEAWNAMEQNICGDELTDESCLDVILNSNFRQNFFEVLRSLRLVGADREFISFDSSGSNTETKLQILNYRMSRGNRSGLLRIGTYNDATGLYLNSSLALTYDANGTAVPLLKITSKCIDFAACSNRDKKNDVLNTADEEINHDTPSEGTGISAALKMSNEGFQEIYPFQRFGISVLVPLHEQGRDFFSCGDFTSEAVFQNVVAIAYALSKINSNEAGLGLGSIIFDFCSRIEKAREQYFSFFSGQTQQNYPISMAADRIVASISFDDNAAEAVSSILTSNYIPHFSSPVGRRELADRQDETILSSVPSRSAEIRFYISALKIYDWKFVSVIYDNDLTGTVLLEMFRKFSREEDICIGDSLAVPKRLSKEYAYEVVETVSPPWKPRVVVLLLDDTDNIRTILEVFDEQKLEEDFIFLSGNAWGNKMVVSRGLERISAGSLTFTLETYDLPDFRNFLANLTLQYHEPISKKWFDEYFQHKYQCKLSESQNPASQFENECLKTEETHPDNIIQDPFVFHTILSVNSIAHGLDSYIRKQCNNVRTVTECKIIQAELLLEIVEQGEIHLNNTKAINSLKKDGSYGYHVWNFRKLGNEYGYVSVGHFKNGRIKLDKSNIQFKIGGYAPKSFCTEEKCLEVCSFQSPVYAILNVPEPLPIDHNFRNVYGIVVSSLSLLGIIVILVILVYFMMTFPSAEGSSILGYFILIGCLMIYSVNFAFIFQPTIGTCSLRRFLMGLAYSVVFSAMLIKVIHSWRLANYPDEEERGSKQVCMLILVCVALIMVEIILAAAWLILYPPTIDLLDERWRCSPSDSFETELVISLVYVMILIASTLLFCNETWQCRDTVKQTRWILFAGTSTAVTWLIWTVVATQAPIPFRDPAIVIGNLVSASSIILFLYARRFYIYSYLTEDLKDLEMRSQFSSSFARPVLSRSRSMNQEYLKSTINPLRENMPGGTQFVGDQEVSFRTVTLPPNRPHLRRSSTRTSRVSRSTQASQPSFNFSIEDDLPTDLNFNAAYVSSDEDMAADAIRPETEDDIDSVTATWGDNCDASSEKERALPTAILTGRRPSIRRIGSRQMLVFLTDGSSMGEVSRI